MHNPVVMARWRLVSLFLSQCAHFLACYCLRIFVVLWLAAQGATQRDSAWHLVTALFLLPAIFLVPLYGAAGNSLPKRAALAGSAAYCLAVAALFAWWGAGWLLCVGTVALGSALFTSTRYAFLPAAAQDANWPLPRVVSAIETGAVLCIVIGMVMGGVLEHQGVAVTMTFILTVMAFSLATALPVRFASDVYRPEPPWPALRGFFADCGRLLKIDTSRGSLLAVCLLRGLVAATAGALIADALARYTDPAGRFQVLITIAVLTFSGMSLGSLLAGFIGDRDRTLGLVPLGATGMVLCLGWIALHPPAPAWLCFVIGMCGGVVNVPLLATFQASVPSDARGNGMAILNTGGAVSMTVMSLVMAGLAGAGVLNANGQLWFVVALCGLSTLAAWRFLGARTFGWVKLVPRPSDAETVVEKKPVEVVS